MKQLESNQDQYETELRMMEKLGQENYLKSKERSGEWSDGRPWSEPLQCNPGAGRRS